MATEGGGRKVPFAFFASGKEFSSAAVNLRLIPRGEGKVHRRGGSSMLLLHFAQNLLAPLSCPFTPPLTRQKPENVNFSSVWTTTDGAIQKLPQS